MSSYPILNNKPIDQWKVTELKEELRRRRLPVGGLKDALVKKLDEALRKEMEMVNDEEMIDSKPDSEFEDSDDKAEDGDIQIEGTPNVVADTSEKTQNESSALNNDGSSSALDQGGQGEEPVTEVDPTFMEAEAPAVSDEIATSLVIETSPTLTEETAPTSIEETALDAMEETLPAVTKEMPLASMEESGSAKQSMATNNENAQALKPDEKHEDLKAQVEDIQFNLSEPSVEGDASAKQNVTCYNSSGQDSWNEKQDIFKPDTEDVKLNLLIPENQVSVVSLDLGSQVKSESLPTDSMSIIEKNKLKGNLNANDFHIEQEVIKQEMVQPSSNSLPVPPVGGDQHNSNDDKELVENLLSVEGASCENAKNHDINKKEDSLDVGSPEKLNLDRSSGDESMEEDAVQSKHCESNVKTGELGEPVEIGKPHTKEGAMDSVTSLSNLGKENSVKEEGIKPTGDATVKRKHEAPELAEKNENVKRQRRWNSETIKVTERQVPNPSVLILPKNEFQPPPRRTFTNFDHKPADESPKERIVPPSQNPSTTSLRIDRFLRPFTLKAVQELLGKTGTVCNFWMDHIKTHCYVTYSSVEEAIATRNAVYNLRWPVNGGNLLIAEFVDPKEVKERIEPPQQAPLLITPGPRAPITPSPRAPITPRPTAPKVLQQNQSEQPPARHSFRPQLPPPPPLHEKERLPPPPAPAKKPEPPPLTLDDLFVKTNATPRIYYLPLTDDQVAAKLAAQDKSIKN